MAHLNAEDQEMRFIAAATFTICDTDLEQEGPSISYNLYEGDSLLEAEKDVLSLLNEDGSRCFPAFHEASEPCILQRPLSDLVNIWHPDKIDGSVFCLHLYERAASAETGRADGDDPRRTPIVKDEEPSSELETLFLTPSPPEHLRSSILFRLTFAFKDSAPVDHGLWVPLDLRVKLSEPTESLPLLVKEAIEEVASKDENLTSTLINHSHQLFVRPEIHFGDEREIYSDFTRKVRVHTLADFFPSTPALTTSIPVQVKVKLRAVEDALSDLTEAIVADTEIGYQFFRLGSLKTVRTSNTDNSSIPVDCAVVAWLEEDGTVHLNKVHTWLINGMCLGECHAMNEAEYDTSSYDWTVDYEDAENIEELSALVRAYSESDEVGAILGEVPLGPTYSFRLYDPTEHGMGLDGWPKTGIRIAVKIVNMLPKHSGGSNIIFPAPENFQLEVEPVDTAASVAMLIEGELMEEVHEDGRTSSRLFQSVLYGKWRMEMWVLPQIDGQTTMFRYTEGSLTQFLDPDRGRMDGRLYLEAHIVPRSGVQWWDVRGSARSCQRKARS
ncbi:hypothetical protein LTR85_007925 [Meristemomyces frigidus]|nr:hypothetical protein LTR85_007925 [Meristemomyces frigidus]